MNDEPDSGCGVSRSPPPSLRCERKIFQPFRFLFAGAVHERVTAFGAFTVLIAAGPSNALKSGTKISSGAESGPRRPAISTAFTVYRAVASTAGLGSTNPGPSLFPELMRRSGDVVRATGLPPSTRLISYATA